ncbi:ABC transporter substrate-binding protein [Caballeronia mineralivorans]|uniref:ABC transporter substrate-binding protein n=1 Tax=Caballeronia mineralivorans TaxID=2010198 RepID=UPI00069D807E|nr:ABC transporter substrate-binding protein [Caballeronia mineralivorans]
MKRLWKAWIAGAGIVATCAAHDAMAQRSGDVLHLVGLNPPSASIHEEYTFDVQRAFMPVFNNLVIFDQAATHHTMKEIKPDLAESWSWDSSHTVLTFRLRTAVKWHDGQPFSAKDVKCTWDTLRGAREAGWRNNPRAGWYQNLKDVTVDNDRQVSFHLARPQPSLLEYLASGLSPVYPCHVSAQQMRSAPIGTGPFKVAKFERGKSVQLVRNPDYFKKGHPYLDGVTIRFLAGGSMMNQELGFTSGIYDQINLPYNKVAQLQLTNPKARCEIKKTSTELVLVFNHAALPFNDVNVRRAFAYAIDRNAFLRISNNAFNVGSLFRSDSEWGRPASALAAFPGYGPDTKANLAQAQQLMRQAGYGPEKPLNVELITRNSDSYLAPTTLVADQLSKIYVNAKINLLESSVWYATRARKNYQLAVDVVGTAVDDPDDYFSRLTCQSPTNISNYCKKEFDEQIAAQSQELDPAKRKALVLKIDDELMSDAVRPTLYHSAIGYCTQPYVKGLTISDNGGHFNSFRLDDTWLDK